MANSDSDSFIGPVIPSHLLANSDDDDSKPPHATPGPSTAEKTLSDDGDDDFYGPALPPGFKKPQEDNVIGPILPPNWKETDENSSEEEDLIGPMPSTSDDAGQIARIEAEFEKRAEKMKRKLTGSEISEKVEREEWMTQLPPEMGKNFGLGPRTFSKKPHVQSGDKSIWTDTPAEKERKELERLEGKLSKEEEEEIKNTYDEEMAKIASEHNEASKRNESLIDLHKKQLKRKAEEEKNKPQERRPFDRDVDLKVNRFDEAQRDSIIKRSRMLGTRFSSGQAKFL